MAFWLNIQRTTRLIFFYPLNRDLNVSMHYHLTSTLRFMCCMSHLQTHQIFPFSLSLWIMSLSHHSAKLGTIHMSHSLIPLINALFIHYSILSLTSLITQNFLLNFISATIALWWLIIISCLSLYWPSYTPTAWQSGEIIYVFLLCILQFKDTKC